MHIIFYEKSGCINNTKQKKLLESCGHTITSYSLLTHAWTSESLRSYMGQLPVPLWFNVSAPRIKSGELNPSDFNEQSALEAMVADPLLIRRPLIAVGSTKICGFDHEYVQLLINNSDVSELLSCPNAKNTCD